MSLKNILLLKKYSFLKQTIGSNVLLTPLSERIKENIAIEWIKSIRDLPTIDLFVSPSVKFLSSKIKSDFNSYKSILENYNNYYDFWSEFSTKSIGIIQRFHFNRDKKSNNFFNSTDCLVFALFCPKHESLYWFQKLQSVHNQWFRNFSKSPLKSSFYSEINKTSQKWVLNYKSDDFDQQLETIEYFRDTLDEKSDDLSDFDVISCNVDLDHSLIGYLIDAFTEKVDRNGNTIKKMKFHSLLAPFKIAFIFRDNTETNEVLTDLTNYLISSLNEFNIPVLPFNADKPLSIDDCDELGIPFTVIVDNESPRKGVIALRNRDSDTEESVHISRFQLMVCLYLNVIHPSIIRNKY